jgi:hypothetical protein
MEYYKSKSVFYTFLSLGLAVLAGDYLLVYLPMTGWILQAIIVGVYFEYLKTKKTIILVAVMETFFVASYGGSMAVAAIVSLVGADFFLPITISLYFTVFGAVLLLGYLANRIFHRIRLFDRLRVRSVKLNW